MNRRELLKRTPVLIFGAPLLSAALLEGCTFSEGADEFINILNLMSPAVDGIVGIVELVDPGVGAVVQAGVTIFEQEIPIVTKIYNDWKAANAASAPGELAKLNTVVDVLKQDAVSILNAAHVKDAVHQQAIDNLLNAVLGEITEIEGLITVAQAQGGTTKAALHAGSKKATLGHPVTRSAQFKHNLLAHLNKPTGDANLDKTQAEIAAKIKAAK
jgi:hypothetical protein